MIVNVKKCDKELQYVTDLGLLDLTSMLGRLFASGVVKDWSIEEFTVEELKRPRNEWLYKLEEKYLKNG